MAKLSHMDDAGRPRMVDVSGKSDTIREAVAKGTVRMQAATFELIEQGGTTKGDVLSVAQLAGIMAAKRTSDLIPLCHPLLIGNVSVDFTMDDSASAVEIKASVNSIGKTGVEMEALTAVAVSALTIYDMCKAADRDITIDHIRLTAKSGGKSGVISIGQDR